MLAFSRVGVNVKLGLFVIILSFALGRVDDRRRLATLERRAAKGVSREGGGSAPFFVRFPPEFALLRRVERLTKERELAK